MHPVEATADQLESLIDLVEASVDLLPETRGLLAILEAAAATSESRRTPAELLIQLRAAGVASPAESLAMIRADRQR